MPPVGAAIAAVAGAIGTAVSGASAFVAGLGAIGKAVLSIGLSVGAQLLSGALAKKPVSNGLQLNLKTGGNVPRAAVFGRTATEGHLAYFNTYGPRNGFLQLVYVLSDGGACDALEKVWVDGEETELKAAVALGQPMEKFFFSKTGRYYGWVRFFNGADNQAADSQLVTHANPSGRWTNNHRGRGVCYVSITLQFHEKIFSSIPQFRFQLRGLRLYDWRKDSTNGGVGAHRWGNAATYEWSDNPAVILYNYQRGLVVQGQRVMGEGVAAEDLDHALFTAAANACDENVSLKAGGTEKRYRFGGTLSDDAAHAENITPVLQAMAGDLLERVGEFAPIAGVAQSPVMTVTDGDLVIGEPWSYSGSLTRSELVNAVFGQFADPTQMWELASFPPRTSSAAELEDGGQRYGTDLTLGGVSSGTQGQRIAEIVRRQARLQRTEDIVVGVKFRPLDAGDWIVRQSGRYGNWIARVVGRSMAPEGKISLSLREIDSSVYAWNPTVDELDGTTPADLPSTGGLIETVSGLDVDVVEIVATGKVKRPALRITWSPPEDPTITDVVIEYRIEDDTRAVEARFQDVEAGTALVVDGIQANAIYEARATIITQPPRATEWTAWITSAEPTGVQVVPEATLAEHATTADKAAGVEAGGIDWAAFDNDVRAIFDGYRDDIDAIVTEIGAINTNFDDVFEQIDSLSSDIISVDSALNALSDLVNQIGTGTTADLGLIRMALSNDPAKRAIASQQGMHVQALDDITVMAYQIGNLQASMQLVDGRQTEARIFMGEQLGVRVNNAVAMIVTEREVRASAVEAVARDVATFTVSLNNTNALLNSERLTRIAEDEALGQRIDNITLDFEGLATVTALNALDARVVTAEGAILSQGSAITDLSAALNDPDTGLPSKASGTAVAALTTRVEETEDTLESQSAAITALGNSLDGKADSSAVDVLESRVSDAEGELEAQANSITALDAALDAKANSSTVAALTNRVTEAEDDIAAQGGAIIAINTTLDGKADASAVNDLNTRVNAAEGTISSQGTALTSLNNAVDGLDAELDTKASAGAVDALTTRVAASESDITATATHLSSLTADVRSNDDVTRLSYQVLELQSSVKQTSDGQDEARTVLREQIQARIDQTNATITLERETRASAFDAIARDVIALNTSIAGKADSTTVAALDSRVTANEGTITSQGTALTNLSSQVNDPATGLPATANAVTTLTTRVANAENTLTAQAGQITGINSSLSGKLDASVFTSYQTTVSTALNGKADASALTAVEAKADGATAQGLFKIEAMTGNPAGVSARLGMYLRQTSSGGFSSNAGMMLELLSNGTSRAVFSASSFTILNGTSRVAPFVVEGGDVIIQSAYIKNLTADVFNYDAINQIETSAVKLSSETDVANMIALGQHSWVRFDVCSNASTVTPMETFVGGIRPAGWPSYLSQLSPNSSGNFSSVGPWVNISQVTIPGIPAAPSGQLNKFILSFQVAGEVGVHLTYNSSGAFLSKTGIIQTRLIRGSSTELDDANPIVVFDGNGDLASERRGVTVSDAFAAGGNVTWTLQARYRPIYTEPDSSGTRRYKVHNVFIKSRSLVVQWVKR